MSEDQFTKLFKYIQHMKADMDARFEMMATKHDAMMNIIDGVVNRQDTEEVERLAIVSQLNRQDSRLDRVESKLSGVESRLSGVESKISNMESNISSVESRLVSIDTRLAKAGF